MTTLYEMFFLLQFLVVFGIILCKTYNIMKQGEFYDISMAWILFMLFFIAWGVGFVITLLGYTETLYSQLFKFESFFVLLNIGFMIAEHLFQLKALGLTAIKANMSNPMFTKSYFKNGRS